MARVAPELTVVVPTRGRPDGLRATLACLDRQQDAPRFEIVVVHDDGAPADAAAATDAVGEEAAGRLPLRIVRGPGTGRAAARNAGAAAGIGRTLLFLDDDVLVGSGFLAAHAASAGAGSFGHGRMRELPTARLLIAELQGADPAAVRDARARLEPGEHEPGGRGPRDPRRRLTANTLERAVEAMAEGRCRDTQWLGFVGANTSVPRPAFEAVGGFDESFGTVWGCEDLELGFRLHRAGLRRRLVPEALGVHLSHARPDRWDQHAVNLERFAALHPRDQDAILALVHLLGPDGSLERYLESTAHPPDDADTALHTVPHTYPKQPDTVFRP